MKYFKLLSLIVFVLMLGVLWGCSGDTTSTTNRGKTAAKSLLSDLQITNDNLDQGQPSVAYDTTNNRYMVVWQHLTADGSSEIRGRLYAGTGTGTTTAMAPVAAEFTINNSGGTRQQPKVAYCNDPANPRYLVVWSDSRNGYGQIYGRHFDKDGSALAADFPISTYTATVDINQIEPDVVYNQVSKKFIVAWVGTTTYDSTVNAGNSLVVQGTSCSNTNAVKYVPLPLVDNYLIRSIEVTPSNGSLTVSKNWSSLLSKGPTTYNDGGFDFVSNYSKTWTAFSDEAKPKVLVSNTDGTYYVAWSGGNYDVTVNGNYTIFSGNVTRNVPRTGGSTFVAGDVETITEAGRTITTVNVYLADGKTSATATTTITGIGTDTITVTINAASALIGTSEMVVKLTTTGGISICNYEPIVTFTAAAKSGQLITAIKDDGLGLSKFYTFGSAGASSPSLSLDPNTNRMLVVWEDTGQVINGQLVDLATFNNYGTTIPISTSKSTAPVVAFDNVNQRFLVAWEDARNQSVNLSNMDIYSQFIDPQGQLSGGNTIITTAIGNQLAPALTFGGTQFRQFMLVWKDGRASGDSDIFGQLQEWSMLPQLAVYNADGTPNLISSFDFGTRQTGQSEPDITFKLKNDGNAVLHVTSMSSPSQPFSFVNPLPTTINPGASYDMVVHFNPLSAGTFTGQQYATIINSDGGTITLYFTGTGIGLNNLSIATIKDGSTVTGETYSQTLFGIGGLSPFKWEKLSEKRNGVDTTYFSFSNDPLKNGEISGTPTIAGIYDIIVKLTDGAGSTATASYKLNVSSISINTTPLSAWTLGVDYTLAPVHSITGTPVGSLSWMLLSGERPTGLDMGSDGVITGTPSVAGTYSFAVQATDTRDKTQTAQDNFSITINPKPSIVTTSMPNGIVGSVFSQPINISGGTAPLSLVITGGLPPGLTLNSSTGLNFISGTPTQVGDYTFTVSVEDSARAPADKTQLLTIKVIQQLPSAITTTSLQPGSVNSLYSQTLNADGKEPFFWSIDLTKPGSLPTGLILNATTGMITGIPTETGTFTFVVNLLDADAKTATQTLSISISGGSVQFTDGTNQITLLGYGNAYKGTSTRKTVTIKNTSSTAVSIASISSDSNAFTVFGAPFSIAANSAATLDVSFTPVQIMAYSGSITLTDSNGNKYQLAVTGSGIGANVELKSGTGTVSYFNTLATTSLPTQNKPAGFVSLAAADFQITGVTPGAKVTVAVTFASMPANPLFYKIINNNWVPLTGAMVSGNVVTFDITDNGDMDSDITAGVIRDPIVVGSTSSSAGGTVSASGGSGSGCFIATAAFGSYLDPHVMVLRHFRDNVLLQSDLGTAFVKFYYKYSPPIADFIYHHDSLRMLMRFALTPLIFGAEYPLAAGFIVTLAAAWFLRRRLGVKAQAEMVQQAG